MEHRLRSSAHTDGSVTAVPELLTKRLRLRGWTVDDMRALAMINADPRVGAWIGGVIDAKETRVRVGTRPDNLRSRRVMERLGLTYAGETLWRGSGQVWYGIELPGSAGLSTQSA